MVTPNQNSSHLDSDALRMWDRVVSRQLVSVATGRPIRHGGRYGVVVEAAFLESFRLEQGVEVLFEDGARSRLSALIVVETPFGPIPLDQAGAQA